jgi:hypothetical protein
VTGDLAGLTPGRRRPDVLSADLSEVDLRDLGEAERAQIASWKPDTVGEVLFNLRD